MSPAIDAFIALAAIAAVAWLALLADRVLRLLCHVPDATPPRHCLAGHPQPYREWLEQNRPAGALTPTRSDRRRVQEMAWRTYWPVLDFEWADQVADDERGRAEDAGRRERYAVAEVVLTEDPR